MKGSDVWQTLQVFYESILTGAHLPQFDWSFEKDGSIKVKNNRCP